MIIKLSPTTLRVRVFMLVLIVVVLSSLSGCSDKNGDKLESMYGYLGEAEQIVISKLSYDADLQKVNARLLLNSKEDTAVKSFVEFLENELATNEIETSMKRMEVFTPDYKVELACRKFAVIEFVFFEDTNAACLRNEDYFFFVELSPASAENLKDYFDGLN